MAAPPATVFPNLPINPDRENAYAAAYGVLSALVPDEVRAEAEAYLARCEAARRAAV